MTMDRSISHDRQQETMESKARWCQSLSLAERMEMLRLFTDLILSANPEIVKRKDAQPIAGRVRVLTGPGGMGVPLTLRRSGLMIFKR